MADSTISDLSNNDNITIIDKSGKVLVNQLSEHMDQQEIGGQAAMIAEGLLADIHAAIGDCDLGEPATILIQGSNGKICVLPSDNDQFFVTLLGNIF